MPVVGVGVVGGQIGPGAATAVLELRPPEALGCRRQVVMAPGERLELGLLIGAEHVLVLAQRLVVPDAVIWIQNPAGLVSECVEDVVLAAGHPVALASACSDPRVDRKDAVPAGLQPLDQQALGAFPRRWAGRFPVGRVRHRAG
jgi:hypothetical protein